MSKETITEDKVVVSNNSLHFLRFLRDTNCNQITPENINHTSKIFEAEMKELLVLGYIKDGQVTEEGLRVLISVGLEAKLFS